MRAAAFLVKLGFQCGMLGAKRLDLRIFTQGDLRSVRSKKERLQNGKALIEKATSAIADLPRRQNSSPLLDLGVAGPGCNVSVTLKRKGLRDDAGQSVFVIRPGLDAKLTEIMPNIRECVGHF